MTGKQILHLRFVWSVRRSCGSLGPAERSAGPGFVVEERSAGLGFAMAARIVGPGSEAAGITAPGHDAAAAPESAFKATVKLKENVRKAGHGYAILEENGPACPAEIRREMRC